MAASLAQNGTSGFSPLDRIRHLMRDRAATFTPLDAYIIPMTDRHQVHYNLAASEKRIEFLSGFTGTGGLAVVTDAEAVLFTDEQFYLQTKLELKPDWKIVKTGCIDYKGGVISWLSQNLTVSSAVGLDPRLVTTNEHDWWNKQLLAVGLHLAMVNQNLVDAVWEDRMASIPGRQIFHLPDRYSGSSFAQKLAQVKGMMSDENAAVLVLTAVDEIAWLFNLRGYDYPLNLGFFSYAIITASTTHLFVNKEQLSKGAQDALGGANLWPYDSFEAEILQICKSCNRNGSWIWVPHTANMVISKAIMDEFRDSMLTKCSPIPYLKTIKNATQLEGMKHAHVIDAVVMCEFLYWMQEGVRGGESITEVSTVKKLDELRRKQDGYLGPSFPAISSSGPNTAIPFNNPTELTCRKLRVGDIYMIDTGAHFFHGTTDVCRMGAFAPPNPEQKRVYTSLLKSIIRACTATIQPTTTAYDLTEICKGVLAENGLSCPHSVGHGVGHCMDVVEGPLNYKAPNNVVLWEGMCCTLEPGCFIQESFGIRLENLYIVRKGGEGASLYLEDIAFVPFDRSFIEAGLLDREDITWLNLYHSKVNQIIGAELISQGKVDIANWLKQETQDIANIV